MTKWVQINLLKVTKLTNFECSQKILEQVIGVKMLYSLHIIQL